MACLCHVFVLESLCVETIDVFHTLKFQSVGATFIVIARGAYVYSFECSEHGSVCWGMNGPFFGLIDVKFCSKQYTDEDAGE